MTHKDLEVWQKSVDLVEYVYKITDKFPECEMYGLSNQIRRAVVSIPSNIAEGVSRQSTKEYIQFLYISLGSVAEVETQIIIANRLNYIKDIKHIMAEIEQIRKMLCTLIRKLKAK